MKKVLPLLLLSLYITSFSGVMLNLHYCAGKLSLVRLFTTPKEIDCCGEVEMDDCCHNDSTWHKIETAHAHSVQQDLVAIPFFEKIFIATVFNAHFAINSPKVAYNEYFKPPSKLRPPLEVRELSNVFRI